MRVRARFADITSDAITLYHNTQHACSCRRDGPCSHSTSCHPLVPHPSSHSPSSHIACLQRQHLLRPVRAGSITDASIENSGANTSHALRGFYRRPTHLELLPAARLLPPDAGFRESVGNQNRVFLKCEGARSQHNLPTHPPTTPNTHTHTSASTTTQTRRLDLINDPAPSLRTSRATGAAARQSPSASRLLQNLHVPSPQCTPPESRTQSPRLPSHSLLSPQLPSRSPHSRHTPS